jgi:sec-independent protein translocase protein TatB
MEIFNVHLFEFLLIAGLALVVFGPERLPEIGRTIGQQVARFLAWQQQSPELQMLNEVRGEFEREIASLRDELVRTRNQLDIRSDVDAIREELRPMLDLKSGLKREAPAANGQPSTATAPSASTAPPAAPSDPPAAPALQDDPPPAELLDQLFATEPPAASLAPATDGATPTPEQLDQLFATEPPPAPAPEAAPASPRPDRLSYTEPTSVLGPPRPIVSNGPLDQPADTHAEELAERRARLHDAPEPADATAAERDRVDDIEREQLLRRLDDLAAQVQALVGELQGRGVIGADWRQPAPPPEQETIPR